MATAPVCGKRMAVAAVLAGCSPACGRLLLPSSPPRGWNSFNLQWDRRNPTSTVPVWNETEFRRIAHAMAGQLLPHGYDTIVIDGGWSGGAIDGYGRPVPDTTQWPSAATLPDGPSFKPLADLAHSLGLKFGVWRLRGATPEGRDRKLPVFGADPPTTIDAITFDPDHCPAADQTWCKCTWDANGVGVDPAQPGAQAYYNSVVDLYAGWGVDLIKWDCMYDGREAAYSGEELLAVRAVAQADRDMILSLSPGGSMTGSAAGWVAGSNPAGGPLGYPDPKATMYRVTGDFHAKPTNMDTLAAHMFVVGNLSSSGPVGNLLGANGTWPDLDMMDLGRYSTIDGTPAAQLHAVIWMMARSPLMYSGALPADPVTLNLLTNPVALKVNAESTGLQVTYRGNCSCRPQDPAGSACNPLGGACTAVWWARLGRCVAVATLNVGPSPAAVAVELPAVGVAGPGPHNVSHVYEGTHETVEAGGSVHVATPAMGAVLLVVSPGGVAPIDC